MQDAKTNIFALTKQDTAVLKGIAIIAMLMHHVWGCPPEGIPPLDTVRAFIGGLGKVCVALFLFCSAYGLSVQYEKNDKTLLSTLKFIVRRLVNFYAGYWPIFFLFVPLGVLMFGRPLSVAYGEHVNILKRLLYDIMGVQGFNSYNITQWFNKMILVFYLLFPIMYLFAQKRPFLTLMASFVYACLATGFTDIEWHMQVYQFAFVMGIIWHRMPALVIEEGRRWRYVLVFFMIFVLLLLVRVFGGVNSLIVDGFWAPVFASLVTVANASSKRYLRGLIVLGTHSMNVYLLHTFIYNYWTCEWIYKYPPCHS